MTNSFKAYKTTESIYIEYADNWFLIQQDWDGFINNEDIYEKTIDQLSTLNPMRTAQAPTPAILLPPIGQQEIWAAGVTYFKSRSARMEEAKAAGGGDFYDRVYQAERPELFFKSSWYRAVGHMQSVHIRKDSNWNVPEPELTLVITSSGKIIGYTIGNDMSSRDIEGENPLYLPQAKSYDKAAAIGPCVLITKEPIPIDTAIQLNIQRNGEMVFEGHTSVSQMKRQPEELVGFLYRETSFPNGCLLMTGTGIVPPDGFTLALNDVVCINIEGIGTLVNEVTENE